MHVHVWLHRYVIWMGKPSCIMTNLPGILVPTVRKLSKSVRKCDDWS